MKIFFLGTENIKIENLLDWHSSFSIIPFLSLDVYKELKIKNNKEIIYDGVFHNLFFNGKMLNHEKVSSIENADVLISPFKFDTDILLKYSDINKKIITFYFDDDTSSFNLPDNVILFRSSLNKSKQTKNEKVLPFITPDCFYSFEKPKDKIGFCGRTQHGRENLLNEIKELGLETEFIIRDGYWHHWANTLEKQLISRREFYKNLTECKYQFCYRGHGNFSYRFTETLNFGRIPILIDSDSALPFENIIDWDRYIIHIKKEDIKKLPEIMKNNKIDYMNNRKLWQEYFSPIGYFNNFLKEI